LHAGIERQAIAGGVLRMAWTCAVICNSASKRRSEHD
jgi:hypothetical protein